MTTSNAAGKQKPWTIMIYLAGDNNLSEEMVFALRSMIDTGTKPDTRVIALYDTIGAVVPFDIGKNLEGKSLKATEDEFINRKTEFFKERKSDLDSKIEKLLEQAAAAGLDVTLHPSSSGGGHEYSNAKQKEFESLNEEAKKLDALLQAEEKNYPEHRRFRFSGSVSDILEGFIVDSVRRDQESGSSDRQYALILSGHGSGAVGDFLTSDKQASALSIHTLNTALIQARDRLLKKGKWIDILGFDSCLMSMSEVAFEVKDSVHYMIGSEGFEPNSGWPYDKVLEILNDNPHILPRHFASEIVNAHTNYYDDYTAADLSVDSSALDLNQLQKLSDAIGGQEKSGKKQNGLAPALIEGLKNKKPVGGASKTTRVKDVVRDAVILAHWEAQGYKDEQYCDLWDFCGRLKMRLQQHSKVEAARHIVAECKKVQDAISKIVFNSQSRGAAFQHSHGIAIYFPWSDIKDSAGFRDVDHYRTLVFPGTTEWAEFLSAYLEETKRQPRAVEEKTTKRLTRRVSFLDVRPGLTTGAPENEPGIIRVPWSNFRVPFSNFRVPFSNFRVPFSNFRVPFSNFRVPFSNFRVPFSNFRVPFSNFRVPFSNFRNSSGGGGGSLKISSMKNPPIDWYE